MSRKLTDYILKQLNNVVDRYAKYGVRMSTLIEIAENAPADISDKGVVLGIRLALSHEYHEREYFTIEDAMEITGESKEEIMQRIEELGVETFTLSSSIPGLFN